MKNSKKTSLLIFVIVLIIGLILLFVLGGRKTNENGDIIQNVNMNNNSFEDLEIDEVIIKKGKVNKVENGYTITMEVINNTDKEIDLSNYRISFRDKDNNEIEWFRGTIIGKVLPKDKMEIVVESSKNLEELNNIFYEKDFFE